MLQLVYISSATVPFSATDKAQLCAQAGKNNHPLEITGVLAYKSDKFVQCLEGPKADVEDTFLRIINDTRHNSLFLLSRKIITRREFGEWDMACCDDEASLQRFLDRIAAVIGDQPISGKAVWRGLHLG